MIDKFDLIVVVFKHVHLFVRMQANFPYIEDWDIDSPSLS